MLLQPVVRGVLWLMCNHCERTTEILGHETCMNISECTTQDNLVFYVAGNNITDALEAHNKKAQHPKPGAIDSTPQTKPGRKDFHVVLAKDIAKRVLLGLYAGQSRASNEGTLCLFKNLL